MVRGKACPGDLLGAIANPLQVIGEKPFLYVAVVLAVLPVAKVIVSQFLLE
jgi:hypothetical protein